MAFLAPLSALPRCVQSHWTSFCPSPLTSLRVFALSPQSGTSSTIPHHPKKSFALLCKATFHSGLRAERGSCPGPPFSTALFYWPYSVYHCYIVLLICLSCISPHIGVYIVEHRPVSVFTGIVQILRECPACSRPTVPVGSGFCWTAQLHHVLGTLGTSAHLGIGVVFQTSPSEGGREMSSMAFLDSHTG